VVWVKVDDRFDDDQRIAAAGLAGAGLLIVCQCYCNRVLSDGFVPMAIMQQKAATMDRHAASELVKTMVRLGIFTPAERDGISGYQVHPDFNKHQPTREEAEKHQAAAKERKKNWLQKQRGTRQECVENGVPNAVSQDFERALNTRPDPQIPRSQDPAPEPEETEGLGGGMGEPRFQGGPLGGRIQ
jgi:hypothetical protein